MATSEKQAKGRESSGGKTIGAKAAAPPKTTGKSGATGKTATTTGSGRGRRSEKPKSAVSGRFVSPKTAIKVTFGDGATKESATARMSTPGVWLEKSAADPIAVKVVEPGTAASMKVLATTSVIPKGPLNTLNERVLLQVLSASGKSETFALGDALAAYAQALRTQLDEVVLPSMLARLIKGAAPIAPEDLAERMLSVAPAPAPANKMAEQVGPEYYDTSGVKTILAAPGAEPVSKQAVEHRRNRHTILALQTTDRRWIYPTWQFRGHEVLPGLADVLAPFYPSQPSRDQASLNANTEPGSLGAVAKARSATRDEPFSRWSVATWVTTPLRELDGLSVADWLLEDRDRDRVVRLSRRTAAAWAA